MRLGTLIGLAAALLLAACATPMSPERDLQIACAAYADTLRSLAVRNRLGLMSGDAQGRVDEAVAIIAPVCEGTVPIDPASVLDSVEAALIVMIEERNRAHGD